MNEKTLPEASQWLCFPLWEFKISDSAPQKSQRVRVFYASGQLTYAPGECDRPFLTHRLSEGLRGSIRRGLHA